MKTTVPAGGEAMPSETYARGKIAQLGYQISSLLDAVPGAEMVAVHPAHKNSDMPVQLASGVDAPSEALVEEPWSKAKRLAKELAETLSKCDDGRWMGHIWPWSDELKASFEAINRYEDGEYPLDRVDRLAHELAYALDDWRDHTGTKFVAHVYPASSGRGLWFRNASIDDLRHQNGKAVQA